MLSATTAGYAATLAGIASLQSGGEATLIAARSPTIEEVARLGSGHDALAARLEEARRSYGDAADAYARAMALREAVDRNLALLAATVAEIDGVARNLPTSIRVPVQRTVVQVKAPPTITTTGASGG
jgi:hypothetical protein